MEGPSRQETPIWPIESGCFATTAAGREYKNEVKGHNSRLDEIQAAVLRVKLQHLDAWNTRRQALAARYLSRLRDVPGLGLPQVIPEAEAVWHLFVVDLEARDAVKARLRNSGVDTLIHYPVPPHLSEAYAADRIPGEYPITERAARSHLSLPMGPHLSVEALDHVCQALREACGSR